MLLTRKNPIDLFLAWSGLRPCEVPLNKKFVVQLNCQQKSHVMWSFLNFLFLLLAILIDRSLQNQNVSHEIILLVEILFLNLLNNKYSRFSSYAILLFLLHFNLYCAFSFEAYLDQSSFKNGLLFRETMIIFNFIPFLLIKRLSTKLAILIIVYTIQFSTQDLNSFDISLINFLFICPLIMAIFQRRKDVEEFVNNEKEGQFTHNLKSLIEQYLPTELAIFAKKSQRLVFCNESFKRTFYQREHSTIQNLRIIEDSSRNLLNKNIYETIDYMEAHPEKKTKTFYANLSSSLSISLEDTKRFTIKAVNMPFNGVDCAAFFFENPALSESISAEVDKEKNNAISIVTHELRTPLIGILGMLNIIENRIVSSELKKYITISISSAKVLLGLINSILDFDQLNNNKLQLNLEYLEINSFLEEIRYPMTALADQKGIEFRVEVDENMPSYIFTDKNRLQQVLINLIGNALKFTLQGSVTLRVSNDIDSLEMVEFSVIDTGVGISKENIAKLFKKYGKLEQTASINKYGAGLGLNISEKLVRALSFDDEGIKVESEVGKGSKFSFKIQAKETFTLPERDFHEQFEAISPTSRLTEKCYEMEEMRNTTERHLLSRYISNRTASDCKFLRDSIHENDYSMDEDEKKTCPEQPVRIQSLMAIQQARRDSNPSRFRKSSFSSTKGSTIGDLRVFNDMILLVDDNPVNLLAASIFATEYGLKVKTALNGKLCLEAIQEQLQEPNFFKLILLDCHMPIMDGYETATILREKMRKGEIPEIPIIALTANDSKEDERKALDAGMHDFLTKPLNQNSMTMIFERFNIK